MNKVQDHSLYGISNIWCVCKLYFFLYMKCIDSGCNISNGNEGVRFTRNADGRASGEAFVQLETAEDVKLAVAKNKEHMGKRYIDGNS